MSMLWFIPLAAAIGILGTKSALDQRHLTGQSHHNNGWWLTFAIAWAPTICWMLAQFVQQD